MNNIIEKIFGEKTYYNLQVYPLMIMLIPCMVSMFINILFFLYLMIGYGIYAMVLKYGKISNEQKYKIYRYIDSTIYDIDWHKAIRGWIDVDISETYPLTIKKINEIQEMKSTIMTEHNSLNVYKELVYFAYLLKKYQNIKKVNKINSTMSRNKIDSNKVQSLIKENTIKELFEEYVRLSGYLENIKSKTEYLENSEEFIELINEICTVFKLDGYFVYQTRIRWSDIYSQTKQAIILLPSNFDLTFNFTDDYGNCNGIWLKVPNFACATFIEIKNFKGIPILLNVFSSIHAQYYMKLRDGEKIEKLKHLATHNNFHIEYKSELKGITIEK